MARRWQGKAQFFTLYVREAHAKARNSGVLNEFGDELMAKDANGDNQVTFEEFGGEPQMFEPFDINNDTVVQSHELLSARKIDQFAAVEDPETMDERMALAKKYREECPGDIPVLVDGIDNAVAKAYGKRPNSAFVIGKDGKVTHKFAWANERDVERSLVELLGDQSPETPAAKAPDWGTIDQALAAAKSAGKPVLLEFTSPGCGACDKMKAETLADADIEKAMKGYEVAHLGVENDDAWALFEALELAATPAFVIIEPGPRVGTRVQGFVDAENFGEFLAG